MISRIVAAAIFGALVGLGCLLLGIVLATIGIPPIEAIGAFLERWWWVIGLLFGLGRFFGVGP